MVLLQKKTKQNKKKALWRLAGESKASFILHPMTLHSPKKPYVFSTEKCHKMKHE